MRQGPDWKVIEYGQSEADQLRRIVRDQIAYISHLERKVEALRREVALLLEESEPIVLGVEHVKEARRG